MSEDRGERKPRPRGGRRPRRKVCSFCVDKIEYIDYKDVNRLRRFTNERGKTRSVSFAAGRSTRRIGICGKTFSVAITTQEEDVLIRPISLTVDFYEGGEHAV